MQLQVLAGIWCLLNLGGIAVILGVGSIFITPTDSMIIVFVVLSVYSAVMSAIVVLGCFRMSDHLDNINVLSTQCVIPLCNQSETFPTEESVRPSSITQVVTAQNQVVHVAKVIQTMALFVPRSMIRKALQRSRVDSMYSYQADEYASYHTSPSASPKSRSARAASYGLVNLIEPPILQSKQGTVLVVCLEGQGINVADSDLSGLTSLIPTLLNVCRRYEGVIYKFSLTSLTVTWNLSYAVSNSTLQACECAWDLAKVLQDKTPEGIRYGIGISSGALLVGDIGDPNKRTDVIHGLPLTMATDIATLNFVIDTNILLTEYVHDAARSFIRAVVVDMVPINGHTSAAIYELRDVSHTTLSPKDGALALNKYNEAFSLFRTSKFLEASDKFEQYLATAAEDKQAQRLRSLCQLMIKFPQALEISQFPPIYSRRKMNWQPYEELLKCECIKLQPPGSPLESKKSPVMLVIDPTSPRLKDITSPKVFADEDCVSPNGALSPLLNKPQTNFGDKSPKYAFSPGGRLRAASQAIIGSLRMDIVQAQNGSGSPRKTGNDRDGSLMSDCGSLNMKNNDDDATAAPIKVEFIDRLGGKWKRSEKVLGKGAFGEVYLGMRATDGELVAMKTLRIPRKLQDKMNTKSRRNKDPHAEIQKELDALISEVSLLADIDHKNLVHCMSSAVVGSYVIIIMEYVAGGSLYDILKQFRTLPIPSVQKYTFDVLTALQVLHEHNFIHRDIKPHNILLHVDGTCKITDFGASVNANNMTGNQVVGTAQYIAPEQAKGASQFKSDIWSLGISVIQLLVGELPYEMDGEFNPVRFMHQLAYEQSVSPKIPSILPPYAKDFVGRCLERDVEKRASAEELLDHPFLHTDISDKNMRPPEEMALDMLEHSMNINNEET